MTRWWRAFESERTLTHLGDVLMGDAGSKDDLGVRDGGSNKGRV